MRFKVSAAILGLAFAVSMNASQLFTNGSLATNGGNGSTSFSGWVTGGTTGSDDDFYADNTDITPLNGNPTAGPDSPSAWYAVSDMTGLVTPETSYLIQTVTIPVGTVDDLLTLDLFVNDQFGSSGLGGEVAIWASGADPLTTAPLTVVYGPADTAVVTGAPNPWVAISQDITADVTAGTSYEIGVLESDSTGPINVGAANFSLVATPASSVPEPGMLLPAGLLAAGMFAYRARRRARAQV
jgi:hypothetical protein